MEVCKSDVELGRVKHNPEQSAESAPPNKSLERTARQLVSHQSCAVSLRLLVAGRQPLNSSVSCLYLWAQR
jgi:hypothetical protein